MITWPSNVHNFCNCKLFRPTGTLQFEVMIKIFSHVLIQIKFEGPLHGIIDFVGHIRSPLTLYEVIYKRLKGITLNLK